MSNINISGVSGSSPLHSPPPLRLTPAEQTKLINWLTQLMDAAANSLDPLHDEKFLAIFKQMQTELPNFSNWFDPTSGKDQTSGFIAIVTKLQEYQHLRANYLYDCQQYVLHPTEELYIKIQVEKALMKGKETEIREALKNPWKASSEMANASAMESMPSYAMDVNPPFKGSQTSVGPALGLTPEQVSHILQEVTTLIQLAQHFNRDDPYNVELIHGILVVKNEIAKLDIPEPKLTAINRMLSLIEHDLATQYTQLLADQAALDKDPTNLDLKTKVDKDKANIADIKHQIIDLTKIFRS